MTQEQFLEKMVDLLESETEITMETRLEDVEEWDSLSYVSFLAMATVAAGKKIEPGEVKKAESIQDLYNLVK